MPSDILRASEWASSGSERPNQKKIDTDIAENVTLEDESDEIVRGMSEDSDFHIDSEDEPNDHDLLLEEGERHRTNSSQSSLSTSKSNEQKLGYEQLVLQYFEFPESLKKKKRDEIKENENITSNWQRHLKTHSTVYQEYTKNLKEAREVRKSKSRSTSSN
ncbi:hypothetical protein OUZ56_003428 [Daphnia magna]|uniref:Uncharacterized protein n=1 Tax=Daphnia magna TaxID=35525 RepID=A0ABR0A8P7_9CRUS|nr:hypothetical protein OUZ56_003428 [Daphnia magna]